MRPSMIPRGMLDILMDETDQVTYHTFYYAKFNFFFIRLANTGNV